MKRFTDFETEIYVLYLSKHSGEFTAYEFAEKFMDGKFTPGQIMGKALAMEMTQHIKKITKAEREAFHQKAWNTAKNYQEYERLVGYGSW